MLKTVEEEYKSLPQPKSIVPKIDISNVEGDMKMETETSKTETPVGKHSEGMRPASGVLPAHRRNSGEGPMLANKKSPKE